MQLDHAQKPTPEVIALAATFKGVVKKIATGKRTRRGPSKKPGQSAVDGKSTTAPPHTITKCTGHSGAAMSKLCRLMIPKRAMSFARDGGFTFETNVSTSGSASSSSELDDTARELGFKIKKGPTKFAGYVLIDNADEIISVGR